MNSGQLGEIGNDAFQGQTLIKKIGIQNQQMRLFGFCVFNHLQDLSELHLQGNPCVNTYVTTRPSVLTLINQLASNCPPSFGMIEAEILNGPAFKNRIEQEVSQQVSSLYQKLYETERRVERLENRITECCV